MSGFTALNGSSPKAATKSVTASSPKTVTASPAPAPASAPASEPAPAAAAPAAEMDSEPAPIPASAVEAPVDTPSEPAPAPVETPARASAREPLPTEPPAATDTSASQSPTQRESWPTQGLEATPASSTSHQDQEPTNKRKRSASSEGRSPLPTQPLKRTQRVQQPTPDTAGVAYYQQDGQYQTSPTSAPEQQGVQHQQSGQVEYTPITVQTDSRGVAQYQTATYAQTRSNAVVQLDPKKRKRNFSNRTKTGCLTCRRRKKKCDEAKPECNNCIKGAFVCAGYPPQRGAGWPKIIENKAGGVPLESKDPNYVPPGAYGMPASPYTNSQAANGPQQNGQGAKREPLPQYRGQNLRIDPSKGSGPDNGPPSGAPNGSASSPEHKLPPGPYPTGGSAYPTPVSANTQPPAFGDRAGGDYPRSHDDRSSSSNAQLAAQMALAHAHPSAAQHSMSVVPYDQTRRPTQKEEMLAGGYFFQFDGELAMERDRAAAACWRFNTLTYPPTNGVSTEERARLFLEIVQPRDTSAFPSEDASTRTSVGRVGRHVAVESPFHCDYGYNVNIGNNVVIGRGCHMNDAGRIQIGDNSIIGPNVSMYTIELSTDPKHRQGGHGLQLSKGIIIDSDCWIGGGVTIMPGKVIGKGSTVGAGSVVTKDVPPFTVVAGNPARVLRGVASL